MNLIIDGSFVLYRDIFALHKQKKIYTDLIPTLNFNLKKLKSIFKWERIYITGDSKIHWRKTIYADYKAQRIKDETIDWDWIFTTFEQWKVDNFSQETSITIDGLEGDDIIAHLIESLNANNKSCVIYSGDGDFNQLLHFRIKDNNQSYINMRLSDRMGLQTLYLPENYELIKTHAKRKRTLFDLSENSDIDNETDIFKFIDYINTSTSLEIINPIQSLFIKIITGDKSDNIQSIYLEQKKTKMMGIGDTSAKKIWEMIKDKVSSKDYFHTDEFIKETIKYTSLLREIPKERHAEITERIKINKQLVMLSKDNLPNKYKQRILELVIQ